MKNISQAKWHQWFWKQLYIYTLATISLKGGGQEQVD